MVGSGRNLVEIHWSAAPQLSERLFGENVGASFGARLSRRGQGFLVGWRQVPPNEQLLCAGVEISTIPLRQGGLNEARRRRAAANSGACTGAATRGRRGRCESALPTLPAPARWPVFASKNLISEVWIFCGGSLASGCRARVVKDEVKARASPRGWPG